MKDVYLKAATTCKISTHSSCQRVARTFVITELLNMKKILLVIQFFCLFPMLATADIPRFDVVKLRMDNAIVYLKFESMGVLKHGDFCYYDYQGEYVGEVKDVVYRILRNPGVYTYYKELHKLNVSNVPEILDSPKESLFILKAEFKINSVVNPDSVEIISAENGNIYGYTYSDDLKEEDNAWLTKYKIEKLIEFDDEGICHMYLYAIEGAVNRQRMDALKVRMENASKEGGNRIQEELQKLYKQKIIMIGFCSC